MWNKRLESILRQRCAEASRSHDVAHDFAHTEAVVCNVKRLLRGVGCRADIAIAAAYLHDFVAKKPSRNFSKAPEDSARLAAAPLMEIGFSREKIADVQLCIKTASWEHAVQGGTPASTEAYVLRDADLLEATGAHGIARVFSFAGATGTPLGWLDVGLDNPPRLPPNARSADPSAFHHFYSKLLWVHELMFTDAAKKESAARREFLIDFLKRYELENKWDLTQE